MTISLKEFQEFDGSGLFSFLKQRIQEGPHLDYKRAVDESSKKWKVELLKDVSSFANASGGVLMLGVDDPSAHRNTEIDDLVLGVPDAESKAQRYEQIFNSGLDPHVSGIRLRIIKFDEARDVLLIYIPPSFSRPHMTTAEGDRRFYIRHFESSDAMTTHEVRESVLMTASAEQQAREIGRNGVIEASNSKRPMIIMQAIPLFSPNEIWDVFSDEIARALQSESRRKKFNYANFASLPWPTPTISGVRTQGDNWLVSVKRNGMVCGTFRNEQKETKRNISRGSHSLLSSI